MGDTYYVNTNAAAGGDGTTQDLTGANCAWDEVADVNGASFSAGDTISFRAGCTWRERLLPTDATGSSGLPVTFGSYGAGNDPIINGADLLTPWTDEGSNIWYATCAVEPADVYMDEEFGDEKTLKGDLANLLDWWWDDPNDRMYIFATEDPATLYPTWGVEGSQRAQAVHR